MRRNEGLVCSSVAYQGPEGWIHAVNEHLRQWHHLRRERDRSIILGETSEFHSSWVHAQRPLDRDAQRGLEAREDGKISALHIPSPHYAGHALIMLDIWCVMRVDCLREHERAYGRRQLKISTVHADLR